jgi:hypothetical protein
MGGSLKLKVIDVLEVVRGPVRRTEVFLADTAAVLATLSRGVATSQAVPPAPRSNWSVFGAVWRK